MVTVEVTTENVEGFDNCSDFDPSTEIEDALGPQQFTCEDDDGNEVEIDIGAVGEIDPGLIDDGIRYRRMPEDVRERFWRLMRDDPDYLNGVILTAAIRHKIYADLEPSRQRVDVIVGDDVR